jgi:hypothetical protein
VRRVAGCGALRRRRQRLRPGGPGGAWPRPRKSSALRFNRAGRAGHAGRRLFLRASRLVEGAAQRGQFGAEGCQAVDPFQPLGGGRAGAAADEPVPAPHPTGQRDEALTRLEILSFVRFDHGDLRQPTGKLGRPLDVVGETGGARRQRRVGWIGHGPRPAAIAVAAERRTEILAERRGKRLFEAGSDLQQAKHAAARRRRKRALQRRSLARRGAVGGSGLGEAEVGAFTHRRGRGTLPFGGSDCLLRFLAGLGRRGDRDPRRLQRRGRGLARAERRQGAVEPVAFLDEAKVVAPGGVERGDRHLPLGTKRGFPGQQAGQRRFGRAIVFLGAGEGEGELRMALLAGGQPSGDRLHLGGEGGDRSLGILGQRSFALSFLTKLLRRTVDLDQPPPGGVEAGTGRGEALSEVLAFLTGAGCGLAALGHQSRGGRPVLPALPPARG